MEIFSGNGRLGNTTWLYWSDIKRKLAEEADTKQPYEKIVRLKLTAPDGMRRGTDCAEAGTLLRIDQFIPSPKTKFDCPEIVG